MQKFKVKEIRRITKDGQYFLKAGMVYAISEDGYYIYYFTKTEPATDAFITEKWPKKDKHDKLISLYRDYWRFWCGLNPTEKDTGPYYRELLQLSSKKLA